jgi:hypothetical protein
VGNILPKEKEKEKKKEKKRVTMVVKMIKPKKNRCTISDAGC